MIPRTAARGHSFKGAGLYYLHDRGASTSERVEFTETRNLPTDDPKKGMWWMSYTAQNADNLKERAGVDRRGRKATAGAVYSFSLAWHPEQDPDRAEMVTAADALMVKLGLSEHQAVYVAHNDADHKHIHGVVNLVHPENGRTANVRMDHLTMSKWAQAYEEKHGKVYCKAREQNNAERDRRNAKKKPPLEQKFNKEAKADQSPTPAEAFNQVAADQKKQSGFVKHREKPLAEAPSIWNLYERSDSGKAFRAALKEQGYILAKGDRRGFVVVNEQTGKVSSLSRQLQGQRAKDVKARLSDIKVLQTVSEVKEELTVQQPAAEQQQSKQPIKEDEKVNQQQTEQPEIWDREQAEAERQNALLEAADEHGRNSRRKGGKKKEVDQQPQKQKQPNPEQPESEKIPNQKVPLHLAFGIDTYSPYLKWSEVTGEERQKFEQFLKENFLDKRGEEVTRINELTEQYRRADNLWGKMSGKRKLVEEELAARKKNLKTLDWRIQEARDSFESRMEREYPKPNPLGDYERKLRNEREDTPEIGRAHV